MNLNYLLSPLLFLSLFFSPSKKKRHRIKRERAVVATKNARSSVTSINLLTDFEKKSYISANIIKTFKSFTYGHLSSIYFLFNFYSYKKLFMDTNIMKTIISHKMMYNLKGYTRSHMALLCFIRYFCLYSNLIKAIYECWY